MNLSDLSLANIRIMVRTAITAFDHSQWITKGKSPTSIGVYFNHAEMKSLSVEDRVKLMGEYLEWLE